MKKYILGILLILSVFSLSSFGLVSNSKVIAKTEMRQNNTLSIKVKSSEISSKSADFFENKSDINTENKPNLIHQLYMVIVFSLIQFFYSLFY